MYILYSKSELTLLCLKLLVLVWLIQIDLGDRLLPCFKSRSNVPYSDVNLMKGVAHAPRWGPDSSVSEVSTIQLEFKDLSYITGNSKYGVSTGKL